MGTYIIRDVQDFLIERWGQKQMRSDVDLQLAAHAKQVRLENAQLREQNRVLRGLLAEIAHDCEHVGSIQHLDKAERRTWLSVANRIKAALTATSQEG
jgi:hypothetical protein